MQPSSSWIRLVRGTVVIRRTSRLLTLLIAAVTILAVWETYVLSTSTFARRLPAKGEVISHASSVQIVAPRSGVLLGNLPSSGQIVMKHDLLFILQSAEASTAGFEKLEEGNEHKRRETETGLAEAEVLKKGFLANHKANMETMKREAEILKSAMTHQQSTLEMLEARVGMLQSTEGLFSTREIESARLKLLNERERITRSRADLLRLEQRIRNAHESHQQRLAELKERERGFRVQLVDLDTHEREMSEKSNVLTPTPGRISAVLVAAGQAVRQGQVLAVIDEGKNDIDRYNVRLSISPKAIGAVEVGSEVWVEVEPFPAREFGLFLGQVTSIAHMNSQQSDNPPTFVVEAALEPKAIEQFGKRVELRNGMAVKANVVTDRLTIFEWILEPVLVSLKKQNSL